MVGLKNSVSCEVKPESWDDTLVRRSVPTGGCVAEAAPDVLGGWMVDGCVGERMGG